MKALVVGAGPAGLASAIGLKLRGIEVSVLDAREPPLDKACGEALSPGAQQRLAALGVQLKAGLPLRYVRYHMPFGATACAPFPEAQPAWGLRRTALSEALIARATELDIPLHWGTRVTDATPTRLSTTQGDFHADYLIGADGLHSRLRKLLPQGRRNPSAAKRFGLRRHYRMAPYGTGIEVHQGEDAEAYVTPVAPDCVGLAFLTQTRPASFDALLARFPSVEARFRGVDLASDLRGAGELWQPVRRVSRGAVALVGDAAGYLDALTGEGLALAFEDAHHLSEALARGSLQGYARAQRRARRVPEAIIRAMLWTHRHPRLKQRLMRAMVARPAGLQQLVWLNAGILRSHQVGWGALLMHLARTPAALAPSNAHP